MRKMILSTVVAGIIGASIGYALAPNDADTVQTVKLPGEIVTVPQLPAPGTILTSDGRAVEIGDANGCHVLTYAEEGYPDAGDPGDGEWYCAR